MEANWTDKLLKASRRSGEGEEKEFLRLVDQAFGVCSLEIARVLMKTFSEKPDYGTQERVISALASAEAEDVAQAMLEELPRLVEEAPRWVESLIGLEVEKRPALLQKVALRMPQETKKVLRKLLSDKAFQNFYPEAKKISV